MTEPEPGTALLARAQDAELMAQEDRRKREGIEREANALAAIIADLFDAAGHGAGPLVATLNEVANLLPHDARRRVLAYRHQSMPGLAGAAQPRDQFGPLPHVPPRASVMRESHRTIEQEEPRRG